MHIDRSNYEVYLIDYLENNLDKADMQTVRAFLLNNPDIAQEVEQLDATTLEADVRPKAAIWNLTRDFEDVDSITPENFEEFCIAYYEGDLDELSKKRLASYLRLHPESKNVFNIYAAMPFEPEFSVQYKDKKSLKKTQVTPLRRTITWAASSAAAILIGILSYNNYQVSNTVEMIPTVAQVEIEEETGTSEPVQTDRKKKVKTDVWKSKNSKTLKILAPNKARGNKRFEPLASISPINAPKLALVNDINTRKPILEQNTEVSTVIKVAPIVEPVSRTARISQLARRDISKEQIIWETVYAGIRGYNRLTENELALNTATNYEGKVTEIGISAGNFGITRKIKKNISN